MRVSEPQKTYRSVKQNPVARVEAGQDSILPEEYFHRTICLERFLHGLLPSKAGDPGAHGLRMGPPVAVVAFA